MESRVKIAKAIGQCGRVRRDNAAFLAYGTLEGEAEVEGVTETVDFVWIDSRCGRHCLKKDRQWTTPVVFGNVWKSADENRTAAILVNVSAKPQTVRVRLDGRMHDVLIPAHDFAIVENK